LFHQQKYEAVTQYDKALEAFPNDPKLGALKDMPYLEQGQIPQSIEANRKAIELDPGDPLNYIDLAKSYCALSGLAVMLTFGVIRIAKTSVPSRGVVREVPFVGDRRARSGRRRKYQRVTPSK
jgi:tetratricopeptide (TPR) repeat protein